MIVFFLCRIEELAAELEQEHHVDPPGQKRDRTAVLPGTAGSEPTWPRSGTSCGATWEEPCRR